jgi:protein-tyrosine phosphatase
VHVLFVCTGNICRSPTAEHLTTAFAARRGMGELTASSAGTGAVIGYGMEPFAAEVLETLGGDPRGFRARQLSPALVEGADLVVTMTAKHRKKVLTDNPRAMRRTFTLLEIGRLLALPAEGDTLVQRLGHARAVQARGERLDDIADPIGRDYRTFVTIGAQVADALEPLLDALTEVPAMR